MAITPQTNIRLLKVPFEIDNKNQLTFQNKDAQTNYFENLDNIEIEECTYLRKDDVILFPEHIDNIINYNYVMYKNENYLDKWFYAFIENMTYENEGMTKIKIKTDVFQTWQFDIIYKDMFIEREHVNSDNIGEHTIPENLNIGEVIEEQEFEELSLSEYYYIGLETNWIISDGSTGGELVEAHKGKQFSGITVYNKQVSGNQIILFKINDTNDYINLLLYIMRTNADGHINDINNIFIIPLALIDETQITQHSAYASYDLESLENEFIFYTLPYSNEVEKFNFNINKVTNYKDFTPKNNKCFVYPYNYLLVSNNIGNNNIFKYENFSSNQVTFIIELALTIGISGKLTPLNYKGKTRDDDESIPLAKYPICSWSSDAYTNWLTQNAVNIPTEIAFGLVGGMPNYNTSDKSLSSSINTGVNISHIIANEIGNFYSANLLPNIKGGQNTGDVTWASNKNTFTFRCMRAKTEYLKIIDDFFSMYGYKINSVKKPNITGRKNWNYVKTINCNITGEIPQQDIQDLKDIFDNGVTFWHNINTFLDYSQNNERS